MSNEREETIADIVADIRAQNQGLPEGSYALSPLVCDLLSLADRIEASAKREREAGAEAAQICGEIGEMVGREAAKNQSVTNCNRLGNAAKMREALANIVLTTIKAGKSISCDVACGIISSTAKAALAAPPRNCDVGTPEEQHNRFMRFCDSKSMGYCWGRGCRKCMAQWGQLPYEEGESK